MNNFQYLQPNNLDDAIDLAGETENSSVVAGGTNILDLWKYNIAHFDRLINISHLAGSMHRIERRSDGSVRVGALATNAETAYHPVIEQYYPLLSKAILAGASAQIRNMATNGGNLLQRTRCYYFYDAASPCNKRVPGSGCPAVSGYNRMHAILGTSQECIAVFPSDMCVALAALDAVVNISGAAGERSLPFADFHRLPGNTPSIDNNLQQDEIITGIDLPVKGFANNYAYLKIRDRSSYAFALVSVAVAMELENDKIKEIRIALGGVAHKPWRVKKGEIFLAGKEPTPLHFKDAADIILEGAVGFRFNNFKISLAKKAIIRCGMMALHPEKQLPGAQPF